MVVDADHPVAYCVAGRPNAIVITTGALFVSCALSWPIFLGFIGGNAETQIVQVLHFIRSGDMDVSWALRVDQLTAVMLVVITSVSALVHLYSWGYMAEDESQPRFFAYLSLFTFAMLMLVTADPGRRTLNNSAMASGCSLNVRCSRTSRQSARSKAPSG